MARSKNIEEVRKYWKGHVTKWQKSGIIQADYCRKNNLDSRIFSYWKLKFITQSTNQNKTNHSSNNTDFLELKLNNTTENKKDCYFELKNGLGEQFKINVNHESAAEYINFIKSFLSKK